MPSNSRLRVLFIIGSMGGGGAERQMLEILKRIDRNRFEPILYLAVKQGELLPEVPSDVPIFAYWDGTPETLVRRILRYAKLTRLLRHLHLANVLKSQRIDVIYDRTYLATLDAAGGCWLRPTRRISCCVADPGPELELHARFSVWVSRWFARRAYRKADIVLANSEGLRNRVIEYFQLDPSHVKVFNNLLPDLRIRKASLVSNNLNESMENSVGGSTDAQLAKRKLSVDGPYTDSEYTDHQCVDSIFSTIRGKFLIVNAGRLHPQKGHRTLVEAVDEMVHRRGRSSFHLVIFGKGEVEDELQAFIRDHQLEPFVTLAGFVDDPRNWYQNANLFVLPSLFEGMPNALIEAIASGVPALSTNCPSGPKEILDEGRCGGLVPPDDALAMADGMIDAMDHQEEWKSKAIIAQQRIERMFDPETGIRRLENLMQQVVDGQIGE